MYTLDVYYEHKTFFWFNLFSFPRAFFPESSSLNELMMNDEFANDEVPEEEDGRWNALQIHTFVYRLSII